MKKQIIIVFLSLVSTLIYSQNSPKGYEDLPKKYYDLINEAFNSCKNKDFKKSIELYTEAFNLNKHNPIPEHQYLAARSWALISLPDSAFTLLNYFVKSTNFTDIDVIQKDTCFYRLKQDSRWDELLEIILANKNTIELNYNRPLIVVLDSVFVDDQKYRGQLNKIKKQYGWDSQEVKNQWKVINEKDCLNLIIVQSIIDKYGWLGKDIIGEKGNTTLFLIIQHSDQLTQEKYLPMLMDAVKKGNAQASDLAYLADRVNLGQGKKQIYGTQIGQNGANETYYVSPLEDPDNVDKRRLEVGLEPLADYVIYWDIIWDIVQYKKELPHLEVKLSELNHE